MLNKGLYEALGKVFKKVLITNEDQQADIQQDKYRVNSWTIDKDSSHGEQYRVNCPFCKDTKGHLYISYLSYARPVINDVQLQMGHLRAQCFRGNCLQNSDNYQCLEGYINRAMPIAGTDIDTGFDIDCSDSADPKETMKSEVTLEGLRSWVPDWQPINENTDKGVLDYLVSRHVTQNDIDWLNIGWGPIKSTRTGKYLNDQLPWVLIPVVNNNKVVGVQARCPEEYLKKKGIKYWIHPGCRKNTMILNLDRARLLGLGVICEGAFDVLSVGAPGICCFGHTPSTIQKRLIASIPQGIVWLPDTDVSENLNAIGIAEKQVALWNKNNVFSKGAHVVILSKKDPGEMSRQEVWEEVITQVPNNMQQYLIKQIINRLGE